MARRDDDFVAFVHTRTAVDDTTVPPGLAGAALAGGRSRRRRRTRLGDAFAIAVSADGRRVAFRDLVVDVETMAWSRVPHTPGSDSGPDGFATEVRMVGFTDDGLVYEGAPFDQGVGTSWLLRDDGCTVRVDPPEGSHISDGAPADTALSFDDTADSSDTCTTSYVLRADAWVEHGYGCMGRYLGEALQTSPDGRWLLTDDLPEVWDLQAGAYDEVEVPRDIVRGWGEDWFSRSVWESDDSSLPPRLGPLGQHRPDQGSPTTTSSRSCAARCRPARVSGPVSSTTSPSPRPCGAPPS